ncbi:MAG: hypothetical protein ACRCZP_16800 [Phycicoccus sp.]
MPWQPDYVTVTELADHVGQGNPIDVDPDDAARIVAAASRAVDQHCRRQFGVVAAPEPRRYVVEAGRARVDDLMTVAGALIGATPLVELDFRPLDAPVLGRPWASLLLPGWADGALVTVTARWGWTTVPDAVKYATLLQASRFLARRGTPFGVAGSPEMGNELRLLARVDPDVAVALAPYRRAARPG